MQKKVNIFLWVGIFGTFIMGSQLAVQYGQAIWGNRDMWWTPKAMAVSLDETRQHFEMFLRDDLLQNLLVRKSLSATDLNGKIYQVGPEDITIRLNNWYAVKASFLHVAILWAFLLGISVTCLFLGVMQLFSKEKEKRA